MVNATCHNGVLRYADHEKQIKRNKEQALLAFHAASKKLLHEQFFIMSSFAWLKKQACY